MNLDFLKELDWHTHDGINLPMINDIVRNQFYDKSLTNSVANCNCVDIGFGTGLLSMLALKHGAKHVTAFESHDNRYQLGKLIIEKLNLKDRITLINQRYNSKMFDELSNIDMMFTETMDINLWGEGLFSNLPRKKGINFLPNNISVKIYACIVSDRYAKTIQFAKNDISGFDPGVDVDSNFVNLINKLGFPKHIPLESTLSHGMISFNCHKESQWGYATQLTLLSVDSNVVAEYSVNTKSVSIMRHDATGTSTNDIDFNVKTQELIIDTKDWADQNVLLVPRVQLNHNNSSLTLDNGCWGGIHPVILVKPQHSVTFSHNLLTGNNKFNYNN